MPSPSPSASRSPAPFTLPSWLALGGLGLAETLYGPAPLAFYAYLFALVGLTGRVWAGALGFLLTRLPRLPWLGPWLLPAGGLAAGAGLAYALGAPSRLAGPYRDAAVAVIAACALGGVGLAALLAAAQQTGERPALLRRLPTGWRAGVATGLAVLVGSLFVVDRMLYVGLYPAAHLAMRGAMALLATLALFLTLPPWSLKRGPLWIVTLAAIAVLLTLTVERRDVLQAFVQRPLAGTLLTLSQRALDLDRDGFPALLAGGDCDDLNPAISPAAREVPNNGIDDNCYMGDATAQSRDHAWPEPTAQPAPLPPRNVVLVTVDTLRADRIEPGGPMPNLSRLAKEAVVFERAYAPGSWTSISLGAMLRGRYPRRLLWTRHYETDRFRMIRPPFEESLRKDEAVEKMFPLAWDDPSPDLASLLRLRGMRTLAVVDDGFSQMLSPHVGAGRGFDLFVEVNPMRGVGRRSDAQTSDMAIEQLRWALTDRPFFMWVHYFGPHAPDRLPVKKTDDGSSVVAGYDRDVRYLDRHLQRLLAALWPHRHNTALLLSADHGEAFFRTYRSHGMDLSDELLRVPLLAWIPGVEPQRIAHPVSLIDIMPTALGLTNTPIPEGLDGVDLAPLWRGGAPEPRDVFADNWFFKAEGDAVRDAVAVFDGSHKLTLDRRRNAFSATRQHEAGETALGAGPLGAADLLRSLMAYLERTGGEVSLTD